MEILTIKNLWMPWTAVYSSVPSVHHPEWGCCALPLRHYTEQKLNNPFTLQMQYYSESYNEIICIYDSRIMTSKDTHTCSNRVLICFIFTIWFSHLRMTGYIDMDLHSFSVTAPVNSYVILSCKHFNCYSPFQFFLVHFSYLSHW